MLLINSHILKIAPMLKPSAEYNRRIAIIEGWALSNGNNSVLWIPEINRRCGKIYGFRTVQRRFQYASEEESLERTYREDRYITMCVPTLQTKNRSRHSN
ncbi:hypothetical protein ALC56_01329 [Trachymyrmex septentrionalis]|uniref:Uncharacterized protein n=1 Tax=Trachymyrmex septentrionalis TaxID=34720 RepID=A0A151K0S6_9HYME|nr:hypothetical protein ALC56_01329 [Trachymyrmex septentrionalis]